MLSDNDALSLIRRAIPDVSNSLSPQNTELMADFQRIFKLNIKWIESLLQRTGLDAHRCNALNSHAY
ncbi:hypothetical protein BDV34DRAFT_207245 [Aspergillus parasiticus]|uniref:Uncharacterized protein n=1 Tax=Aspergillus parasiticus TaxID=5067 RepID=A0A5N6D2W2_ASPPA|nr:hypothetical protein BDV34DRAFT_207245 [Aspergillus parasiticus]